MCASVCGMVKSLFSAERDVESTYDGYTPSRVRPQQKAQTFDEAIKHAPIRDEWIDENYWGYIGHLIKNISPRTWFEGFCFVVVMAILLVVMPTG